MMIKISDGPISVDRCYAHHPARGITSVSGVPLFHETGNMRIFKPCRIPALCGLARGVALQHRALRNRPVLGACQDCSQWIFASRSSNASF